MVLEEVKVSEDVGVGEKELFKLLLFNSLHFWDDVVIQLCKATGFEVRHCEQIAMIAHTKGKAVVKSGNLNELEQVQSVLKEIDLITKIE